MLKHTALVEDDQCWQTATDWGYFGGPTFFSGNKVQSFLLPLRD